MRSLRLAGLVLLGIGPLLGYPAPGVAAGSGCAGQTFQREIAAAAAALQATPSDARAARVAIGRLVTEGAPALGPALADLDRRPPDVSDARRRLSALADVLALPPGSGCPVDPGPAGESLRRVYSSPIFAGLDASERRGPLVRVLDALDGLLRPLASSLPQPAWGALVMAGLVALGVLGARRWRRLPWGPSPERVAGPRGGTTDPGAEWRAAELAAGRAEYREAVRRAFRSALLSVASEGRLAVAPSWTTGQLLEQAVSDTQLAAVLGPAASSFDRAWYSGETVTRSQWDEARARCHAVRALGGPGRRAATSVLLGGVRGR